MSHSEGMVYRTARRYGDQPLVYTGICTQDQEKKTLKCNLESNEQDTDLMLGVYATDVVREIVQ